MSRLPVFNIILVKRKVKFVQCGSLKMKILSWNINGIRASKIDLKNLFDSLDADIICLQETKITQQCTNRIWKMSHNQRADHNEVVDKADNDNSKHVLEEVKRGDMLDEPTAIVDGYNSYYSYSRKRSGYSGVATYCKNHATPEKAEEGLSHVLKPADLTGSIGCYGNHVSFTDDEIQSLDAEGRTVITQHKIKFQDGSEKDLAVINVYCPRFDPDREDRHIYKLRFYALLQTRAEALLDSGCHVIILGDINTTHKAIDHCDPEDEEICKRPSRRWMNQMMWETGRDPTVDDVIDRSEFIAVTPYTKGGQFIDTFRHLYPTEEHAYSNWCTLKNARACNFGRRLDYIMGDINLVTSELTGAWVMREVEGSDHCPVKIELQSLPIPAKKCPGHCTKYMPEFSGTQQKLSMFFTKVIKRDETVSKNEATENVDVGKETDCSVDGGTESGVIDSRLCDKNNEDSGRSLNCGKRSLDSGKSLSPSHSKKQKTVLKKGSSVGSGKQKSLANFFMKSQPTKPTVKVDSEQTSKHFTNSDDTAKETESVNMITKTTEETLSDSSAHKNDTRCTDINKDSGFGSLVKENSKQTASAWKNLLGGLGPSPLCKGHNEPCVLRMVKKAGPNKGKQFYTCARGEGHKDNPEARCDFFKWVTKK